MTTVLDASALLAFLGGEDGADIVEGALDEGAACGTANWSEVAQQVLAAGRDWDLSRALLSSYDIESRPVTVEDAEAAALRWQRGTGLSLADRLCLALADRLDAAVLTADRTWGTNDRVRQIR
jgi:PIN domain nuclease of toxin-antitoxin system